MFSDIISQSRLETDNIISDVTQNFHAKSNEHPILVAQNPLGVIEHEVGFLA